MIQRILDYLGTLLHSSAYRPWWTILVEMILIGVVVYGVLRFLHGTRGANLLQGLIILLVSGFLIVRVLADWFGLERLAILYQPFVWTALVAALVVFQPELRRGLMRIGEARFRRARQSELDQTTRAVAAACAQLSKNKIGALIAIEREIGLAGTVEQGVRLDALITPELLNTIFWPGSALHDLGVIIQGGRVAAAGCPFPLSDAEDVERTLGSRHRAAIGLSYESDALIIIVSEETGTISLAERGRLDRPIAPDALAGHLRRRLANTRGGDLDPPRPSESREDGSEHPDLELPPLSATIPEMPRGKKPAETATI